VDPIFSTGVCLGMMSAVEAAAGVIAMLCHAAPPARVRRRYNRYVERTSAPFFRMVRAYYEHPFREMFVNGQGPLEVHKAALSVLAGSVFPRPAWAMRWRLWLLYLLKNLSRWLPLVPRREHFSLFGAEAEATAAGAAAEAREASGESPEAGEAVRTAAARATAAGRHT
jgi:hypothetical protein